MALNVGYDDCLVQVARISFGQFGFNFRCRRKQCIEHFTAAVDVFTEPVVDGRCCSSECRFLFGCWDVYVAATFNECFISFD